MHLQIMTLKYGFGDFGEKDHREVGVLTWLRSPHLAQVATVSTSASL